jgi:hypothetical protein
VVVAWRSLVANARRRFVALLRLLLSLLLLLRLQVIRVQMDPLDNFEVGGVHLEDTIVRSHVRRAAMNPVTKSLIRVSYV